MKTRIKIIIQDYEIKDAYGLKTLINTDNDLYNSVIDYYIYILDKPLVTSNNISRELKNIILYSLTETEIFKLLILSSKALQELKRYGITRGTELITIKKHYTSV